MGNNFKLPAEWLKQAEYDMGTAISMFKTERFIYAVFMCHLAIEKVIKGIYSKVIKKDPPKTHDLVYLSELTSLNFRKTLQNF
jgi:HEPN domain-containing protein